MTFMDAFVRDVAHLMRERDELTLTLESERNAHELARLDVRALRSQLAALKAENEAMRERAAVAEAKLLLATRMEGRTFRAHGCSPETDSPQATCGTPMLAAGGVMVVTA